MWVSLQDKTNPNNYSETSKVNPAGIRWKEYVLNWGGLTNVRMFFFSEARSNACREKSADDIVPEKKNRQSGKVRTLFKRVVNECYLMKGRMQKISTLNDNCPQKDSSENDSYVGVQTFIGITENHLVEVQFTKDDLLERILSPDNLNRAYKQVMSNGGSGGVDKMETEFLLPYLKLHKDELINTLLDGNYRPNPVLRVEIPQDGGKKRQLGIPTVVDRLIQQSISQVLSPLYEYQFSDNSFGFRPKRSAHQALKRAQSYISSGYKYSVDLDLEKFFDTVNHSKLIEILSRTLKDGRVISLIHKYLLSGVIIGDRYQSSQLGVPQGGPLSPLLSNIMLNELDKSDFQNEKGEIIAEIKQQVGLLGKHGDINFGAVNQNIKVLDENIRKVLSTAARIRKQQQEAVESQKTDCSYFNFRFFKVRKSSFVIVGLGLLVFILTLFCMKQQNDYTILNNEYCRKSIVIREMQTEMDSLSTAVQKPELVKKRQLETAFRNAAFLAIKSTTFFATVVQQEWQQSYNKYNLFLTAKIEFLSDISFFSLFILPYTQSL